ncbi:MAG: hypothetical protein MZV64_05630 [Ignavibacteriales bacterium]|nr:hypothetical protein [Ignavibacteriales bacterium]
MPPTAAPITAPKCGISKLIADYSTNYSTTNTAYNSTFNSITCTAANK